MPVFEIEPIGPELRSWMLETLDREWGPEFIVTRGRKHNYCDLPGIAAILNHQPCGLATYSIENGQCELTSLNSFKENIGIGSALLNAVRKQAEKAGCRRIWLITLNDNTGAIHYYQKRGYRLSAIYIGSVELSRRIKPSIPQFGNDGIPLRDEIELELLLPES
jgi:GNAT superfamily N-acetyltransferase